MSEVGDTGQGSGPAFEAVADRIRRLGPLPFDQYLELALYHPEVGFYETGGTAGRRGGDFITSPEVGPLFGAVLARAFDTWWRDLGEPDPFVVVDAGAGPGTLAVSVAAAPPGCSPALSYIMVERSAAQRARHGDHLALTAPEMSSDGAGPRFVSLGSLPAGRFHGVVIANELLDNLPFRLMERTGEGWAAVRVALSSDETRLVEHLVPAPGEPAAVASSAAPDAEPGDRVPVQSQAAAWLRDVLGRLESGRVVVIDYGSSTASLAGRSGDWLRTYEGHQRGLGPLDNPGGQDITAEVAIDQLVRARQPIAESNQADFLRRHGLDQLVDDGRGVWQERAHLGDLEAIRARSRVSESEALVDPTGLGGFRVLEWESRG